MGRREGDSEEGQAEVAEGGMEGLDQGLRWLPETWDLG